MSSRLPTDEALEKEDVTENCFLNQQKRENDRRNIFMTKSPRMNVPDVGIKLGAACMPSGHASDRATAPSNVSMICQQLKSVYHSYLHGQIRIKTKCDIV